MSYNYNGWNFHAEPKWWAKDENTYTATLCEEFPFLELRVVDDCVEICSRASIGGIIDIEIPIKVIEHLKELNARNTR